MKYVEGLPNECEYKRIDINRVYDIYQRDIKEIYTNNPSVINIYKKKPSVIKRNKKRYIISFKREGSGCIKICFIDGSIRVFGFFIGENAEQNIMKVCSVSQNHNFQDYWDKMEIGGKYVHNLYTYVNKGWTKKKDNIYSYINNTMKYGMNCIFIYRCIEVNKINDNGYIVEYIKEFKLFIRIIESITLHKIIIIFEPNLISEVYKDREEYKYKNLEELIKEINKNNKCNIEIAHVITYDIMSKREYLCYFYKQLLTGTKYIAFNKECEPKLNENKWIEYFNKVKGVLDKLNMKGILYDLQVGHPNNSLEISPYTHSYYDNHMNIKYDREDFTTVYLFGGKYKLNNKIYDISEHISQAYNSKIRYIMFGASEDTSTSHIPLESNGYKYTDHNYTISKIQKYIKDICI